MVYASSSSVYGGNTKMPFSVEDRVDQPISLYAATKKADELMGLPLREARETFEREYLLAQVTRFGGNISRTAHFVGMERSALHRKLKSLGVHQAPEKLERDEVIRSEQRIVTQA